MLLWIDRNSILIVVPWVAIKTLGFAPSHIQTELLLTEFMVKQKWSKKILEEQEPSLIIYDEWWIFFVLPNCGHN